MCMYTPCAIAFCSRLGHLFVSFLLFFLYSVHSISPRWLILLGSSYVCFSYNFKFNLERKKIFFYFFYKKELIIICSSKELWKLAIVQSFWKNDLWHVRFWSFQLICRYHNPSCIVFKKIILAVCVFCFLRLEVSELRSSSTTLVWFFFFFQ